MTSHVALDVTGAWIIVGDFEERARRASTRTTGQRLAEAVRAARR